jgi:Ca2+-binding EF-hand superfamily protein
LKIEQVYRRHRGLLMQLGFKAQPAFLSKFGKEEKRRVCLDVHQFVACISVCHSDHINHPKSKQIFTLMDTQRKGEVVLDDFVHVFESTGGAKDLTPAEQKMLQQYIVDAREK